MSQRLPVWTGLMTLLFAVDLAAATVAVLPGLAPILIVIVGIGVLALVGFARVLRSVPLPGRLSLVRASEPLAESMTLARRIFYVGTAFVGLATVRPGGLLTVSDLLFFLSVSAALSEHVIRRRRIEIPLPALLVSGMVLFAVGGIASSFGALSPLGSISVVVRLIYLVAIWFWLATVVLRRPEHMRVAVLAWIASAAVSGTGAVVQTVFGDVIPGGVVHYGRVSGFTDHINDLGGLCGFALVPALMVLQKRSGFSDLQRLLAALCIGPIGAGLALSGSLSGLSGCLVAIAIWTVGTRSYARVAVAGTVILAVSMAVVTVGGNADFKSPLQRLSNSTAQTGTDESTFWTRIQAFGAAWQEIERQPFIGVGLSPSDTPTATGDEVHNILLRPWFEGGLWAMVGMLLLYVATGQAAWHAYVHARDEAERLLALSLIAAFFAYLTWGAAETAITKRYGWVVGVMVFALRAQQLRGPRSPRELRVNQARRVSGRIVTGPA